MKTIITTTNSTIYLNGKLDITTTTEYTIFKNDNEEIKVLNEKLVSIHTKGGENNV